MSPDNTILFQLQEEYFNTKDNRYLSQLYLEIKRISYPMLRNLCRKHRLFIQDDVLKERNDDLAVTIIERLLIGKKVNPPSYTGYLFQRVKGALYNRDWHDKHTVSLDHLLCILTEKEIKKYEDESL